MSTEQKQTKGQRLFAAAKEAAELRAYRTHPDVAALAIERVRSMVDALVWAGLVLGLLFTMSNVQGFASAGKPAWSLSWMIAWLLDPMVSLVLVGLLIGCSVLARYQIKTGRWVHVARWGSLAATYAMNTWSAWASLDPAAIVLHSVPPALVFLAAEAITDLREKLTEAVAAAYRQATERARAAAEAQAAAQRELADRDRQERPAEAEPTVAPIRRNRKRPHAKRASGRYAPELADVTDLLPPGRRVWAELAATGQPRTKRQLEEGLRASGVRVGAERLTALLRALKNDSQIEQGNDDGQEAA